DPLVPRANVLTDVAAENPISQATAQLQGNGVLQFDRQVTDAFAAIEHVRLDERAGRTSIQACPASAAMICRMRRIVFKLDVSQQRGEEEPASCVFVEQERVLADPAEPGQLSEFPLQ